ncbi:hypothetical protein D9615_007284 [Tricholomella constricta]|uniref:Uncharacterized protein n=1 Tax=Tricholomella constricta TaxID=117010 RepID=A0A8H5H4L7_9AGAR|nr:hypothetical protein D9615_007284 [Tricholomella constricta]
MVIPRSLLNCHLCYTMSILSTLPKRLTVPARLIFKAAAEAKVPAILFGGAAAKINGMNRDTKDLDINMKSIGITLPSSFYTRVGSAKHRLTATFNRETNDAIRCDIVAHADIEKFLPYTALEEDIRYALPPLLLADKIRTYGERARGNDQKRSNDLDDITQMIDMMLEKQEVMPKELIDWILTKDVMERFWATVGPADAVTYKHFLELVKVPV